MNSPRTVIVADDHPLFRTAMREALKPVLPGARVIEADSYPSLQQAMQQHGVPDLVLLDLVMPGVRGFSSLLFLRSEYPSVPVVVGAVIAVRASASPAGRSRAGRRTPPPSRSRRRRSARPAW